MKSEIRFEFDDSIDDEMIRNRFVYTYRNPWAAPYESQEYRREVEPVDHAGCQIFHVSKHQYDVVKNGVCISQRGGFEGAKLAAESVRHLDNATFQDVRDSMFRAHGHV